MAGKRVSWVELYLDLVFVLAVGRLAHVIVAEPAMRGVWIALGLFVTLWWTWIGFAVLYNRQGADERRPRLIFLAGSVPAGVAAVAIEPASEGDSAVFALSLAVTRLILAGAHERGRTARAYLTSAALFALSIVVPEPWRYALWAIGIGIESSALLSRERGAAEPLEPRHFAERFGLFLIILLGEVVISAGEAPEDGTAGGWAALVAAMVLAATLWWLYFDAAAERNLRALELAGGSPAMARAIFAAGHMLPAFALILTASGLALLLEGDPPAFAYWLGSAGIGIYLAGTRVFLAARGRVGHIARVILLVATFQLAQLNDVLAPHEYVWLLMAWTLGCAALATAR